MSREESHLKGFVEPTCCRKCGFVDAMPRAPQRPRSAWTSRKPKSSRTVQPETRQPTRSNRNQSQELWGRPNSANCASLSRYNNTYYGRVGGFTDTFLGGMQRDSRLNAATREKELKESEDMRKRKAMLDRMNRLEDFHERMIKEIGYLKLKEERAQLRRKKIEQMQYEEETKLKSSNCKTIQAFFRGALSRKHYQELRIEFQNPKFFDKHGQPKDLLALGSKFQRVFSGNAKLIQRRVRGFCQKQKYKEQRKCILRIQRFFRGCLRKREKVRFDKALQRIQAACRGYLVRNILAEDDEEEDDESSTSDEEGGLVGDDSKTDENKERKKPQGADSSKKNRSIQCGKEKTPTKTESAKGIPKVQMKKSKHRTTRLAHPSLLRVKETRKARKKAALNLQKTYRGFRARKSITFHHPERSTLNREHESNSSTIEEEGITSTPSHSGIKRAPSFSRLKPPIKEERLPANPHSGVVSPIRKYVRGNKAGKSSPLTRGATTSERSGAITFGSDEASGKKKKRATAAESSPPSSPPATSKKVSVAQSESVDEELEDYEQDFEDFDE